MKRSKRIISLAFVVAFVAFSAQTTRATTMIANYTFDSGSHASTDGEPNSTAANWMFGSGFPSGAVSGSTNMAYVRGNDTPSTESAAADTPTPGAGTYYEGFNVTINPGTSLNLTSFVFGTLYNNDGDSVTTANTANYAVRSSVDNYSTDIVGSPVTQSYSNSSSGTPTSHTLDLTGPLYQNLTGAVGFRIYLYDDSSDSNSSFVTVRTDNVSLNGTAVTPEPSSLALVAVAGLMLVRRRRRLR